MTVPRRFIGAWDRLLLNVDGSIIKGTGRAVWLEAGGTYLDVRAPGTLASNTSFGGRSSWRSPIFTWHHDVDLHPQPGAVDRGELTVDGDRIVERGTGLTGDGVPYTEHWHRFVSTTHTTMIATHRNGLAVRVGDHAGALSTVGRCARVWQYVESHWTTIIAVGPLAPLPRPAGARWRLPRGWREL
jgi:hypothetical protein